MVRALSVALLTAAGMLVGSSAQGAPTDVVVTPVIGPAGSPISVSGAGCTGDVTVQVLAWLITGGDLEVLEEVVVTPAATGVWAATITTPERAARVEARCDGVTSTPVAVTGVEASRGSLGYAVVRGDELVIAKDGLVDGTAFRVVTTSGELLGENIVQDGGAEVVLPRSVGPAIVVALSVQLIEWVEPPEQIASAEDVTLPFAEPPTVVAEPRVATPAEQVSVSGDHCRGDVSVSAFGHSEGWDHVPQRYLSAAPEPDETGSWSLTMPMPGEVTFLDVDCVVGGVRAVAWTVVGAANGTSRPTTVTLTADGAVIDVDPTWASFLPFEAFTLAGEPVALTTVPGDEPSFVVQGRPGPILLVTAEQFGENAEGLWFFTGEQYFADVSDPVVPPATPAPPDPNVAGRGVPGEILAETGPTPATGPAAVFVGLVLLLVGAAVRRAARVSKGSTS